MQTNDLVNSPKHYKDMSATITIEPIEITSQLDFDLGNCFKYLFRYKHKGSPLLDLQKAEYYLNHALNHKKLNKRYCKILHLDNLAFRAFYQAKNNFLHEMNWDYTESVKSNLYKLSEWLAEEIKIYEKPQPEENKEAIKDNEPVNVDVVSLVSSGLFTVKEAMEIAKKVKELHNTFDRA